MKHFLSQIRLAVFVLVCSCSVALGQENLTPRLERAGLDHWVADYDPPLPPPTAERVLSDFFASERQVREALNHHTFRRDVLIQTIGPNGDVTGRYIRNSRFIFDDKGNRIERVLLHPRSTLRGIKISKEDIQDLAGAQLLGFDVHETGKYHLSLSGKEAVNARVAYALEVVPAQTPNPYRMRERFLRGRVWVDAETLQVLKVRGIVEPQGKQRFPVFETSRQWANGALLFPSSTEAHDTLRFPTHAVTVQIKIRYYEYKRFGSTVKLTELDQP